MFSLIDSQLLETSLDTCSLRQQVTANNIANWQTPGFRGQSVTFESELREAMEEGPEAARQVRPRVTCQSGRVDINNEMATLAKSQIMYQALCNRISGLFGGLKWVIENAGR